MFMGAGIVPNNIVHNEKFQKVIDSITSASDSYSIEVFFEDTGDTEVVEYSKTDDKFFATYPYLSRQISEQGDLFGTKVEITEEQFNNRRDNLKPNERLIDNSGDQTSRLLPLQGTVSEFLQELNPAERKFFTQLSKEGKLKTICKIG